MHVCKDRNKNKSSSLSFVDLENYLLRKEAKTYRLSPNDIIILLIGWLVGESLYRSRSEPLATYQRKYFKGLTSPGDTGEHELW